MVLVTIHQVVALLGLMLSLAVYGALHKFGVSEKICWGAALLTVFVVGIFWTAVNLGAEDEDEE